MAVTAFALAKITQHSLSILVTGDGAGATTVPVPNATILGWFTAAGIGTESPLRRLFATAIADQADGRRRIMGDASGSASQDLRNVDHATIKLAPRTGAGGWIVDIDVDGVTPTLPEINFTDRAVASTVLATIEFQHTATR